MFETPLTVVGHIVNDLQRRKVGDQEVVKFRVAPAHQRRRLGARQLAVYHRQLLGKAGHRGGRSIGQGRTGDCGGTRVHQ